MGKRKRGISVLVALALLLVPVSALGFALPEAPAAELLQDGRYLDKLSEQVGAGIPGREALRQFALNLLLASGHTEQNGIFISSDELLLNVEAPIDYFVQENLEAMMEFADNIGIPTYFTLIPTASAIRQQSLPQYTQTQVFNQKQFIEEVNSQLSGRLSVADTYQALFSMRDQYIYYRTENNLTSLGGYYVYNVLGARLLEGMGGRSLGDYDIEYIGAAYYGGLYQRSPYKNITPDNISLYHYTRNPRQYLVTHIDGEERWTYHTLYPSSQTTLYGGTSVMLGGMSPIVEIRTTAPYDNALLVFGDETALAYVPFLANHYARITVVDLSQLDIDAFEQVDAQEYGQILIAYGVESFMHTDYPSRTVYFID